MQASSGFESQGSDSDFGSRRGPNVVRSVYTGGGGGGGGGASGGAARSSGAMGTLDRLSVRTELGRGHRSRRDRSTGDTEYSS